jgi:hypothetical protein
MSDDKKNTAGGSVVLKERTKGSLIVKLYINDLAVQWELNPPT